MASRFMPAALRRVALHSPNPKLRHFRRINGVEVTQFQGVAGEGSTR